MCKWGTLKEISVIRKNSWLLDDSWHRVYVDACIADYVQEMNNRGIITINSCCGHSKGEPIALIAPESESLLIHYGYTYKIEQYEYLTETGEPYCEPVIEHYIPESGISDIANDPSVTFVTTGHGGRDHLEIEKGQL